MGRNFDDYRDFQLRIKCAYTFATQCRYYTTGIFVASLIFTYHTPPKGISISLKLSSSIISLFRQVNKITRKYQTKEADVQSGYELLK